VLMADTVPAPLGAVPEPTRPPVAEPLRVRVKAPTPVPRPLDRVHRLQVHAIYAGLALGLFAPLWLAALVAPLLAGALALRARRTALPEWMLAHVVWQIRTFWIGAAGTAATLSLAAVLGAFSGGNLRLLHTGTVLMGYRGSYAVLLLALVTAGLYGLRLVRGRTGWRVARRGWRWSITPRAAAASTG
jgi:uncharacterized membrane protein